MKYMLLSYRATYSEFVQLARKTCLVTIFLPVDHFSMICQTQAGSRW